MDKNRNRKIKIEVQNMKLRKPRYDNNSVYLQFVKKDLLDIHVQRDFEIDIKCGKKGQNVVLFTQQIIIIEILTPANNKSLQF